MILLNCFIQLSIGSANIATTTRLVFIGLLIFSSNFLLTLAKFQIHLDLKGTYSHVNTHIKMQAKAKATTKTRTNTVKRERDKSKLSTLSINFFIDTFLSRFFSLFLILFTVLNSTTSSTTTTKTTINDHCLQHRIFLPTFTFFLTSKKTIDQDQKQYSTSEYAYIFKSAEFLLLLLMFLFVNSPNNNNKTTT